MQYFMSHTVSWMPGDRPLSTVQMHDFLAAYNDYYNSSYYRKVVAPGSPGSQQKLETGALTENPEVRR
jgi:hypothetical protein